MTAKAKKRRQGKRKQERQTSTTMAPVVENVTHWFYDGLPASWTPHVFQMIAWVNADLPTGYGSFGRIAFPVEDCANMSRATDGISLCLTARSNLARSDYVAEARFTTPGAGMIAIGDDQPPNPELPTHEAMHILSGDRDHTGGWDKKHPPFDASLVRVGG